MCYGSLVLMIFGNSQGHIPSGVKVIHKIQVKCQKSTECHITLGTSHINGQTLESHQSFRTGTFKHVYAGGLKRTYSGNEIITTNIIPFASSTISSILRKKYILVVFSVPSFVLSSLFPFIKEISFCFFFFLYIGNITFSFYMLKYRIFLRFSYFLHIYLRISSSLNSRTRPSLYSYLSIPSIHFSHLSNRITYTSIFPINQFTYRTK